eukprot:TRINITY_DN52031_c0_g1_i1.p1 TRINITY_DN52031_c0_g1~~TRINITY_DN52031_c0_g1_i1.p1  ORF type:complete len:200 (-),score=38.13 TRINITY_DN52031_c0_g1_i1:31-543(-)
MLRPASFYHPFGQHEAVGELKAGQRWEEPGETSWKWGQEAYDAAWVAEDALSHAQWAASQAAQQKLAARAARDSAQEALSKLLAELKGSRTNPTRPEQEPAEPKVPKRLLQPRDPWGGGWHGHGTAMQASPFWLAVAKLPTKSSFVSQADARYREGRISVGRLQRVHGFL